MSKRKLARISAAIAALLGVLAIILPGLFRTSIVASLGVLSADALSFGLAITGWALIVASIVTVGFVVRGVVREKRKAAAAALANKPYELPSIDETNPKVIQKGLEYVIRRFPALNTSIQTFPTTKSLVETCAKHLQSLQRSIATINDIFQANPLLVINGNSVLDQTTLNVLLEEVQREICKGIVRIIYQAHGTDQDDHASIAKLKQVILEVNDGNQRRVARAEQLANETVRIATTPAIEASTATDLLTTLVAQLSTPTPVPIGKEIS